MHSGWVDGGEGHRAVRKTNHCDSGLGRVCFFENENAALTIAEGYK